MIWYGKYRGHAFDIEKASAPFSGDRGISGFVVRHSPPETLVRYPFCRITRDLTVVDDFRSLANGGTDIDPQEVIDFFRDEISVAFVMAD